MHAAGFEPTKHKAGDLKSPGFDHSPKHAGFQRTYFEAVKPHCFLNINIQNHTIWFYIIN